MGFEFFFFFFFKGKKSNVQKLKKQLFFRRESHFMSWKKNMPSDELFQVHGVVLAEASVFTSGKWII